MKTFQENLDDIEEAVTEREVDFNAVHGSLENLKSLYISSIDGRLLRSEVAAAITKVSGDQLTWRDGRKALSDLRARLSL